MINLLNSTSCYLISSFQSALFGESETYVDTPMLRDFREPIDGTQHLNRKNKRYIHFIYVTLLVINSIIIFIVDTSSGFILKI